MNDFYVYALFRENGQPFYIGKGRGRRMHEHEKQAHQGYNSHKAAIIRKMRANGWARIPKIKLCQGLTDEQARAYEIAWITALGRWPTGLLANKTDGGDGTAGYRYTAEARAKMSASRRGRKLSPEHIAQLRALTHTKETRAKISAALRGVAKSETTRMKMSAVMRSPERLAKIIAANKRRTGKPRPDVGEANRKRICSDETRAKLANAARNMSAEQRAKIGAASHNRSPEALAKMSAAGRSPERLARLAALARNMSDETRAKISAAARKRGKAQLTNSTCGPS